MAKSAAELDALVARAFAKDPTLTARDVKTLLRACFTAPPGKTLLIADLNAIEPRTLAWACGDRKTLASFENGDPYLGAAAVLFNLPLDTLDKKKDEQKRALGKAQIIGCGYGLGNPERFRALAAKAPYNVDWDSCPLTPQDVITGYRETHPEVVQFWAAMQEAAVNAIDGYTTPVGWGDAAENPFVWGPSPIRQGDVWLMLPSGRPIVYYDMAYTVGRRGPGITYSSRKGRKHVYGGLFVENAVQALDRDVMAVGVIRAEAAGLPVVLHTHDEIVAVGRREHAREDLATLERGMCQTPDFVRGLPLKSEGFTSDRYAK